MNSCFPQDSGYSIERCCEAGGLADCFSDSFTFAACCPKGYVGADPTTCFVEKVQTLSGSSSSLEAICCAGEGLPSCFDDVRFTHRACCRSSWKDVLGASKHQSHHKAGVDFLALGVQIGHGKAEECDFRLGPRWQMPQLTYSLLELESRHLLPASTRAIVEFGGFDGRTAETYIRLFPQAKIFSYEPVPAFFRKMQKRFENESNVMVTNVGVAETTFNTTLSVVGDASTIFVDGGPSVDTTPAHMRDVAVVLRDVVRRTGRNPDSITLNCEGCEYGVLERMATSGWFPRVPFIHISWHILEHVVDRVKRRCDIEHVLYRSHEPWYHDSHSFQGWRHRHLGGPLPA